jgi:NAD(P)-dependent dehydrogenase (short-subunit alcohol dehydrogenase family)
MAATIITPFGPRTTASEVIAGIDLTGRRAIVTGAASGIGIETARALAIAGAEVTLAVRDPDAGDRVVADIVEATGNKNLFVAYLNLTDLSTVDAFADTWQGPLDILVNNAGVMAPPLSRTARGWELQFATNHLGHFALAARLHGAMATAGSARIVSVSSAAHLRAGVDFDDLHFTHRPYDPWVAYGQSKTANILFAVEASRRWASDGITANALMPGVIRTNLQRHVSDQELDRIRGAAATAIRWKTPEQGAATSVLVAASPSLDGIGGRYFEDVNEAGPHQPPLRTGVAAHALDPVAARRLWEVSDQLVGH